MLTADSRLCPACRALLPELPAAPVCTACGGVAVLHHSLWAPSTKRMLAGCYLSKHAFLAHRSAQQTWERVLQELIAGAGGGHASPFSLRFEASALECYPLAVQLATTWRAQGAPITHDLLDTIGRQSGLIASSFPPIQRAS